MKALMLVSFMALGGQPHTDTLTLDTDNCRDAMMQVVDQYGLKNHVYSSGMYLMRAHDKTQSLSVSCKPLGK